MARRDCPEAAEVGAEMLAAVRIGLATLRQHLTDPDAKTALRAVAELTKLLSVCARHGIAVGEAEPTPFAAPVQPVPAPAAPEPPRCEPARPPQRPARRAGTVPADPTRLPLDPTATGTRPAALPPGGSPQLTSFLGAPAATGSGGGLAVTSSAGQSSARGCLPSAPSPAAG